jgi:transposase
VRLVLDKQGRHGSRWQTVLPISSNIGCAPQTLNDWGYQAEVDSGKLAGVSSEMADNMKGLEHKKALHNKAFSPVSEAKRILCLAADKTDNTHLSLIPSERLQVF